MPNISDTNLQMFRERAKSELAGGCDVNRLRWDDIVESLCKEVVSLRKELAASGNAAALREFAEYLANYPTCEGCEGKKDSRFCEFCPKGVALAPITLQARMVIAKPPRNCQR